MYGTLDSVIHVVAPYGSRTDDMSATECNRDSTPQRKTMQSCLNGFFPQSDQHDVKYSERYGCNGKCRLVRDESIRNFSIKLLHDMHRTKPLVSMPPPKNYHVTPVPQNSYTADPSQLEDLAFYGEDSGRNNVEEYSPIVLRDSDKPSALNYEFSKVCKAGKFLPNPVSRQLFDELSKRNIKVLLESWSLQFDLWDVNFRLFVMSEC